MANIIRSAKSGSDWEKNELKAYNITVSSLSLERFFPTPAPSLEHIDPNILNTPIGTEGYPAISDAAAEYLCYLGIAAATAQESDVDLFVLMTLRLLRFNERNTAVLFRQTIPLFICGDPTRAAQTDVCLSHLPSSIFLCLVEDKTLRNKTGDVEAQIIAEAIAAFQTNNKRCGAHNLDPLGFMNIPCITMAGTQATFYVVPVTTELSDAVAAGLYPATRTKVLRCRNPAGRGRRNSTGMDDVMYRKLALKYLFAFKTLAKNHWVRFLEEV